LVLLQIFDLSLDDLPLVFREIGPNVSRLGKNLLNRPFHLLLREREFYLVANIHLCLLRSQLL
jgi:hypothetical protein